MDDQSSHNSSVIGLNAAPAAKELGSGVKKTYPKKKKPVPEEPKPAPMIQQIDGLFKFLAQKNTLLSRIEMLGNPTEDLRHLQRISALTEKNRGEDDGPVQTVSLFSQRMVLSINPEYLNSGKQLPDLEYVSNILIYQTFVFHWMRLIRDLTDNLPETLLKDKDIEEFTSWAGLDEGDYEALGLAEGLPKAVYSLHSMYHSLRTLKGILERVNEQLFDPMTYVYVPGGDSEAD